MRTISKITRTEDETEKRARVSKANKADRREGKKLIQKQIEEDLEIKSDLDYVDPEEYDLYTQAFIENRLDEYYEPFFVKNI